MRMFLRMWIGQFVSIVGSGLTAFALGVWVYEQTGSATQIGLIYMFASLPGIIALPFAGVIVDRWSRRAAMAFSDIVSTVFTTILAALYLTGRLEIWHIYTLVGASSMLTAVKWPAFSAATTLIVPKRHLGRASAMTQIAQASGYIISPIVAGALVMTIGCGGVIVLDIFTFLFSLGMLAFVRVPATPAREDAGGIDDSLLRDAAFGWRYIRSRAGLMGLLVFFSASNFTLSLVQVLYTPLVLGIADANTLGRLVSIGGIGMVLGALLMSAWGGPRRRVHGVFGFGLLMSFGLLLCGVRPWPLLMAAGLFITLFTVPIINASSQAIWQTKVAPEVQGRVFATRLMFAWSSRPLAYVASGALADRFFEPLLMQGGALAPSVGAWIGSGPGRGVALLMIVMALLNAAVAAACWRSPSVRFVEDELPDTIPDTELIPPAPAQRAHYQF
ncbi:MAG TPA: MFS transporter [Thermoanaerobaculia bacterium]|nr:MFS transporter [Thermoanaerobaculia bacterium]